MKTSNSNNADKDVVQLKFGVDVESSVKNIQKGLTDAVDKVNKTPIQVAFTIDIETTKKQVKELIKIVKELKTATDNARKVLNSSASTAASNKSASSRSDEYINANKLVQEYSILNKNYVREVMAGGEKIAESDRLRTDARNRLNTAIESCSGTEKEILKIKQKQIEYDELDNLNQKQALNKVHERINNFIQLNEVALKNTKEGREQLRIARELANTSLDPEASYAENQKILKDTSFGFQELAASANTSLTGVQKLEKQFKNKLGTTLAATAIASVARAFKQLFNNVKEVDSALTQLSIVSGKSMESFQKYADGLAESSRKLAVSMVDLIESTTVYARLGYGVSEATKLAELTTMYSRAGDVGISDATANITAILKAFDITADNLAGTLDKVVAVGNNFAISSSEIGEAMNNAASSLSANNNTFEESLAILTAAQTTLQNISKSSTAVRTIAARISASTTDLEELGEEDVLASADLDERMRAYGISIVDTNGELRSTFDVLDDIAKKWDELNTIERAAIAGMVAGTRQQSAFYSIVQNWSETSSIMNECEKASGTLQEAQDKYFNSVEGQLTQLKATWVSLSQSLLNSDFVKIILKGLNSLFSLINDAVSNTANMIIYTLTLLAGAFFIFKEKIVAYWKKAKAHIMKFSVVALIATLLIHLNSLDEKVGGTALIIIGVVSALVAAIIIGCKMAGGAFVSLGAAITGVITNTPIINIIALILMAVTALAMGISKMVKNHLEANEKLAESEKKKREELQASADKLRDVSDAASDAAQSIKELSDEFNRLGAEATFTQWVDALSQIGEDISSLYGEQMSTIEGINKLLDEDYSYSELIAMSTQQRLQLLKDVQKATADVAAETAREAYNARVEVYSNDSNEADGRKSFSFKDAETYDGTKKKYVKSQNKAVYSILNGLSGFSLDLLDGKKQLDLSINADSASQYIEYINKAIEAFESEENKAKFSSLDDQTVYKWLKSELARATTDVQAESEALQNYVRSLTSSIGLDTDIDLSSVESYNKTLNNIVENLKADETITAAIDDSLLNADALVEYATEYLKLNFPKEFEKIIPAVSGAAVELKSFISILDEIKGKYNAITSAMEDMTKMGYLSAESLVTLMQDYPELFSNFLKEGIITEENGYYKMAEDADKKYLDSIKTKYDTVVTETKNIYKNALDAYNKDESVENSKTLLTAEENYKNALLNAQTTYSAINALSLENNIDKYVNGLEAQEEALQAQFETYQKIIELRKELLDTYAEELEYQRELKKKQTSVTDLQTQLDIANLDTSASGKARARELQSQLVDAKEDLDDFTLEHTIESLNKSLENETEENQAFLDEQLSQIKDAINSAGQFIADSITGSWDDDINSQAHNKAIATIKISENDTTTDNTTSSTTEESRSGIGGHSYLYEIHIGEHTKYHTGGFVGGTSILQDNEEFAKLLKGEFVATPKQMSAFMKTTLPKMAASAGNVYNSPLVSITCGSITQESLPGVKTAINQAVDSIKRELDGAMSRSGRGYTIKKVII